MSDTQNLMEAADLATKLATNVTSVTSFSWLDQAAIAVPHILYANTTFLPSSVVQVGLFISIAVVCVLVGSYSTISKPRNAALPTTELESPHYDPTDNDESRFLITSPESLKIAIAQLDSITVHHAVAFPFLAAAALFGLHRAIRYLSAEQINFWLNFHCLLVSFFAIYRNLNVLLNRYTRRFSKLFGKDSTLFFERYKITFSTNRELPLGPIQHIDSDKLVKEAKKDETWLYRLRNYLENQGFTVIGAPALASDEYFGVVFDLKPLIILPLTLGSVYLFYAHNPVLNSNYENLDTNWLILNFISINVAAFAIGSLRLPNFKFMAIIMGGLFIYDIYFVFQSSIMLEVATTINAPIKILVPQQPRGFSVPMSLLGLGDIVMPGVLASLSLRFDLYNHYEKTPSAFHHLTPFARPYFQATVLSYIIGLGSAFTVLYKTGQGQPAMLYIVPSVFTGIILLAALRGEVSKVLAFDETIKAFDEKHYTDIGQEDDSDSDYDYSGEDSLDEWIDRVEEKRIDDATDIDDIVKQVPKCVVYTFNSDSEDDEDDDTYIIGDSEDEAEEAAENSEWEDDRFEVEESELIIIKRDLNRDAQEAYSDDE